MKRLLICSMLIAAACGPIEQPAPKITPPLPTGSDDTCRAVDHRDSIGESVTVLEREPLLQPVRILRPGSAMTLDYLQTRINFVLDADDNITSITCG